MEAISYKVSSSTQTLLGKIDDLHKSILQIPTSPKTDNSLRWQSHIAHISGWAKLSNQQLSDETILDTLTTLHTYSSKESDTKILNYKKALNHVREYWTANPKETTPHDINDLARVLGVSAMPKDQLASLLSFVESPTLHLVIKSAIIQLSLYPSRLAHLASYLYLSKGGFDIHGWISIEDYLAANKEEYLAALESVNKTRDASGWFDFYAKAVLDQMLELKEELLTNSSKVDQKITQHLSHRQKAILDFLSRPETTITNRQIQAMFGISQITASRDLAKLTLAGLLSPHGSGRSTSYTKI